MQRWVQLLTTSYREYLSINSDVGLCRITQRGSSYARRGEHYVRGHYSRSDGRDAYDDYMTQKQSYRSGKSEDCKRKMLAALEEHLDELTTEMSDMSKDAECREERDLVKRYVEKLRDML